MKTAFERIAADWNRLREKPWPVLVKFFEKFRCKHCFENGILLDLGCGNGRHSLIFADSSDYVIGIDFSIKLIEIAKKKTDILHIGNVSYVLADASFLPFRRDSISNVVYLSTLHHIAKRENRQKNLQEILMVLKKKGYALISVWRRWQKRFFWFFLKGLLGFSRGAEFGDIQIPWKKQDGEEIQRFYHLFSKRELSKLLTRGGFQIALMVVFGGPTQRDNIFALGYKAEKGKERIRESAS